MGPNLGRYGTMLRDEFGHLRLGEIEFSRMVRDYLTGRLEQIGIDLTMIDKDLGYELRCADPIPFDAEYTRDLGYGAVKFLRSRASAEYGAVISFVAGKMKPLPFADIINPETQRMKPRMVDVTSESYASARSYMFRLEPADIEEVSQLAKIAASSDQTCDWCFPIGVCCASAESAALTQSARNNAIYGKVVAACERTRTGASRAPARCVRAARGQRARARPGGSAARARSRPPSFPAAREVAARLRPLGLSAAMARRRAETQGQDQARSRRRPAELFVIGAGGRSGGRVSTRFSRCLAGPALEGVRECADLLIPEQPRDLGNR